MDQRYPMAASRGRHTGPMTEKSPTPLVGISSRAWEHPADRGALVALRKLRGFDELLKRLSGLLSERGVRMLLLGSAVRVTDRNYSRVQRLYREAADALDLAELPELYVKADPVMNAMAIGMERPIIVLNSSLVEAMDDDELRFVLGHELGHVASGHAVYRTLLAVLLILSSTLFVIPLGALGARAVIAALMEWSRKAELSADRAGLLAVQDRDAALRAHMKLAGGGRLEDLDPDAFLEQAEEYNAHDDLRDLLLRVLMVEGQSHPFAVVRAGELHRWVSSGAYESILGGEYPLRRDDAEARLTEEAQAAAASYADEFAKVDAAMNGLLSSVGEGLGQARDWVADRLRDLTGDSGRGDTRDRRRSPGW